MSYDSLGTENLNMRTATSHPVSTCVICCNHNYDDIDISDHENHGDDMMTKITISTTSIWQVIMSIIHA